MLRPGNGNTHRAVTSQLPVTIGKTFGAAVKQTLQHKLSRTRAKRQVSSRKTLSLIKTCLSVLVAIFLAFTDNSELFPPLTEFQVQSNSPNNWDLPQAPEPPSTEAAGNVVIQCSCKAEIAALRSEIRGSLPLLRRTSKIFRSIQCTFQNILGYQVKILKQLRHIRNGLTTGATRIESTEKDQSFESINFLPLKSKEEADFVENWLVDTDNAQLLVTIVLILFVPE